MAKELRFIERDGKEPKVIIGYQLEWTDADSDESLTKQEFHAILDKASQPTEKPQSDQEQS